jgi:hypothetical protein
MSDSTCCGTTKLGCISLAISITMFVAFFAVLIAGITIVSTPYDFENLPYFAQTQCTPIAVTVVKMPLCEFVSGGEGPDSYYDQYLAIWKCKETGASIIENPFAGNRQLSIAQNSINDFPLQVTQNVSCNTVNLPAQYANWTNFYNCQVWNTCMYDIDMIEDLQANAQDRYNRGYHLLYASAGIGGVCLIFLTIYFIDLSRCCRKDATFV